MQLHQHVFISLPITVCVAIMDAIFAARDHQKLLTPANMGKGILGDKIHVCHLLSRSRLRYVKKSGVRLLIITLIMCVVQIK